MGAAGALRTDLPLLQSISLGINAIYGDNRNDRAMLLDPPYNFLNALIMKSPVEWLRELQICPR